MLEELLNQFNRDMSLLLPRLVEASQQDPDSQDAGIVSHSFIGPKEVTVGDARLFIFGDLIGRQEVTPEVAD